MESISRKPETAEDVYQRLKQDQRLCAMVSDARLRQMAEEMADPDLSPQHHEPSSSLNDLLQRLIDRAPDESDPGSEESVPVQRVPAADRFSGCFEPDLLRRCRELAWGGYHPVNLPGGEETLTRLRHRLHRWSENPDRTQFIFITGLHARGKTYLQTLIMYRMTAMMPVNWRARWTRASEIHYQLQNWPANRCGWHHGDDRPLTPVETWIRQAPRIIGIDEIDKPAVEYNRSENWVRIWLELLTQLKESTVPRLVVICSNIKSRDFAEWELNLPGNKLNRSTPIASRLTAHDVLRLELGGHEGGRDFRSEPWEPSAK